MSIKAVNMKNLAIVYAGGNAYRVNFSFITFSEAGDLMRNSNLFDKKGLL